MIDKLRHGSLLLAVLALLAAGGCGKAERVLTARSSTG
jgi:hypothetical protein